MSKFVTNIYGGTKEILKFPDHYVAIAVTVDDEGIVANADGKKIVAAGTIVGGKAAPALANLNQPVQKKNTQSVKASVTLVPTGVNNDILVTAVTAGVAGGSIKVELKNPAGNNQVLAVSIVGDTIVASLATDGVGAITSTAAQVIAAINAHLFAKQLVVAANAPSNDGTGVVAAVAATPLAGGNAGTGYLAEGVLKNDADVTHGPVPGDMITHGFIKTDALPEAPAADAITELRQIFFIK